MSLAQIQAALAAHVRHGDPAILGAIHATADFAAETRLAVYAHAYRARLAGVLYKDFPALAACLGDEAEAVFAAYVAAHPSRSFSLRDLGESLPVFLAREEYAARWPWAAELASFEWAFCEVFDAEDGPVLDEAAIAALPPAAWAELRIAPHPALRRLALRFNTLALWKAWKDGLALPEGLPLTEVSGAVVWRDAQRVCLYRSLEADEAAGLGVLAEGGSFPEVCVALLPWHAPDAVALRAASLLKSWLAAGWLGALR